MLKYLFCVLIACCVSLKAQKPVFSESQLRKVVLYEQSAELISTANFNVPKGSSEIVISNIANSIDESSIKVGSKNKISILTYRFSDDENLYKVALDKRNPQHKLVLDSIDLVRNQLKNIEFERISLIKSIEILDKNQTITTTSNSFTKDLAKLVEFYQKKRLELNLEVEKLNQKTTVWNDKLSKLQSKFNISNKDVENYPLGKLILQISSDADTKVDLDIKYTVPEASWRPYYDIIARGMNEKIQLVYKAMISQNSGLDWKNVKLSLISGFPNQRKNIPQMYNWNLYYQEPVSYAPRPQASPIYEESSKSQAMVAEVSVSSVRKSSFQNQLNLSYDLKDDYTILANGQENSINLDIQELPATFTYFAIPKYDPTAFLIAEIDNLNKYNLIKADANIIFQDTNIGKTVINPETTDNKMILTLGDDRRVSVKREQIKEKTLTKNISNTNKEQQYAYEITLRNNKSEKIKIKIKDQIPISSDKQISVSLIDKGNAEYDEENGTLIWTTEVGANETKKLKFAFKVNYLKNKELIGL